MKVTTIISILVAGVIMASCSSDGTTPVAATFSGGIKNTRTSISSNTATWVKGDAIGITAKSTGSGSANYPNEKYTADGDGQSTTFSFNSGDQIYYKDNNAVDFTAYYPFMDGTESGSLKGTYSGGTISKTITSDDETTANQTNLDYLYATNSGVTSGRSIGLTFNHEMCELTLNFLPGNGSIDVSNVSYSLNAGDVYPTGTFNTTTGVAVGSTTKGVITGLSATGTKTSTSSTLILFPTPSTVTAASITLSATISGITCTATIPITSDGGTTPSGMVSGNNYQFNITVNATGFSVSNSSIGAWNSVTATSVTAATSVPATPGTYYFSDGTWGTLADNSSKTPIAVVFSGTPGTLAKNYGFTHGLAIALTDANNGNTGGWGPNSTPSGNTCYNNTLAMSGDMDSGFRACYVDGVNYNAYYQCRTVYEGKVPANPYNATSNQSGNKNSGWYLPSMGEVTAMFQGLGLVTSFSFSSSNYYGNVANVSDLTAFQKYFTDAGGTAIVLGSNNIAYWTSSEYTSVFGLMFYYNSNNVYYGGYGKSNNLYMRAILAF